MRAISDKINAVTVCFHDGSELDETDSLFVTGIIGLSSVVSGQEYVDIMRLLEMEEKHEPLGN